MWSTGWHATLNWVENGIAPDQLIATQRQDDIPWLGSFRSGYEQTCTWHNGHWTCTPAHKPS
ncbi:hypothetical protein [Actinoplanes awajinensis]|uniref:Uncharacterized protein n=1 Tax=Actinoplanes awajinensis subsp. mycoplanecinus TaxID=135947 RepID=A0A0X3V3M9_9ACTN|nr:hypothetical protein [Actinoplanes awajinensis]KUL39288.1 hypothetical protein ADL15_09990 [Actinoplanes awajinensis subsp. mycoplanecinus]